MIETSRLRAPLGNKLHTRLRRAICVSAALVTLGVQVLVHGGEPTFAGPAQGTTYRVRLGQPLQAAALAGLRSEVESLLAAVDRQMSRYHDDTEVSRFNRWASTDWLAVSPDLVTVVRAAIVIHDQSQGTFDATVAPLVDLWGFGPGGRPGRMPSAQEIARTRQRVGSELLETRANPPSLRKRRADVQLDLNGIAPGFAVDRIAGCLERRGVTNYLIRLDGHIRARGHALDGRPWRVGIDRPTELPTGVQLAIELQAGALSTSGDYRRYFEHDGRRYSHIIDPRTGAPIAHAATSVSIVADDCLTADAWAKALMVLGPVDGLRLAERRGIAAYYIVRSSAEGGSLLRGVASKQFTRRFLAGRVKLANSAAAPIARADEAVSAAPGNPSQDRSPTGWIRSTLVVIALGACLGAAGVLRRRLRAGGRDD